MNKLTTVFFTSLLIFGTAACSNIDKTSADASNRVANPPTASEAQQDTKDAQSQIRRRQLDEDIQAREQRNDFFNNGSANNRADSDIASEVRDKLEANLPNSELSIEAENGMITVTGTVPSSEQLAKIRSLAEQIKGVRRVDVEATIAATGSDYRGRAL